MEDEIEGLKDEEVQLGGYIHEDLRKSLAQDFKDEFVNKPIKVYVPEINWKYRWGKPLRKLGYWLSIDWLKGIGYHVKEMEGQFKMSNFEDTDEGFRAKVEKKRQLKLECVDKMSVFGIINYNLSEQARSGLLSPSLWGRV